MRSTKFGQIAAIGALMLLSALCVICMAPDRGTHERIDGSYLGTGHPVVSASYFGGGERPRMYAVAGDAVELADGALAPVWPTPSSVTGTGICTARNGSACSTFTEPSCSDRALCSEFNQQCSQWGGGTSRCSSTSSDAYCSIQLNSVDCTSFGSGVCSASQGSDCSTQGGDGETCSSYGTGWCSAYETGGAFCSSSGDSDRCSVTGGTGTCTTKAGGGTGSCSATGNGQCSSATSGWNHPAGPGVTCTGP